MIELFYANSPNVFKVSILMEELGVPYKRTPVDILNNEQFKPSCCTSPRSTAPSCCRPPPGRAPR